MYTALALHMSFSTPSWDGDMIKCAHLNCEQMKLHSIGWKQ